MPNTDGPFSSAFSTAFHLGNPQTTAATATIIADTLHTAAERIYGYSIAEDKGAAAVVNLRAGSVSGQIVRRLQFSADQSFNVPVRRDVFLEFPGGCYVEEVSGSVHGVLFVNRVG